MHEFTGTVVAAGSFSDPALGRDQFGVQNSNIFQEDNPMMLIYPNAAGVASSFWTINTGNPTRVTNIAILQNSDEADLLMEHDGETGWRLSNAGHNYDNTLGFFLAMTTDGTKRRLMTFFVYRNDASSKQYDVEFLNQWVINTYRATNTHSGKYPN